MPPLPARILLTVSLLVALSIVTAQESTLASRLLALTEQNLLATQAEDRQAIAATMHPAGPGYGSTLDLATQLGQAYDLDYRLLDFHFVALDSEYAYARVKQETRKLAGPQFANNTVTALWVYRRDGDHWRVWSLAILEIDYH